AFHSGPEHADTISLVPIRDRWLVPDSQVYGQLGRHLNVVLKKSDVGGKVLLADLTVRQLVQQRRLPDEEVRDAESCDAPVEGHCRVEQPSEILVQTLLPVLKAHAHLVASAG